MSMSSYSGGKNKSNNKYRYADDDDDGNNNTQWLNIQQRIWEGYVGEMIEEKRRMFIKVHEEKMVK